MMRSCQIMGLGNQKYLGHFHLESCNKQNKTFGFSHVDVSQAWQPCLKHNAFRDLGISCVIKSGFFFDGLALGSGLCLRFALLSTLGRPQPTPGHPGVRQLSKLAAVDEHSAAGWCLTRPVRFGGRGRQITCLALSLDVVVHASGIPHRDEYAAW